MAVKFDQTDVDNIRKFFDYFKCEIPKPLIECLLGYENTKELTEDSTRELKIAFVNALREADHPLANDPVWKEVDVTLAKHIYNESFERDIKAMISDDGTEATESE